MAFPPRGVTTPIYRLLALATYAAAQSPLAANINPYSNELTHTLTIAPTHTTTLSLGPDATITEQPITTLFQHLPAGGSLTSVANGSSTDSYYVYATYASSLDLGSGGAISLCYDCCLWPCVASGMPAKPTGEPNRLAELGAVNRLGLAAGRAGIGAGRAVTTWPAICPTVWPGTGTTTVYTTHTLTRCDEQPVCPNPGWGIIGQPNSTTVEYPGASTVYTTNANGTTSFVVIPTTTTTSAGISIPPSMTAGPTSGVATGGASSTPGGASSVPSAASSIPPSSTITPAASSPASLTSPPTILPTCPYSDGATFTNYYGSQFLIRCGVIFTDTLLDTQTQTQLSDCITACDKHNRDNIGGARCAGASWVSGRETDNCLLFDGATPSPQPGTWSAELIADVPTPPDGGDGGPGNDTEPVEPISSIGSIITPTAPYGPSYTPVNRLITTETVTATTVSVSLGLSYIVSYIVSTVAGATQTYISYVVSTAPGATQTQLQIQTQTLQLGAGATATLFQQGPTVTATTDRTVTATATAVLAGSGMGTETQTQTTREVQTELVTTTAPTATTTVYVYPSSSSSSSFCRLYPTEYLRGRVPVRRVRREAEAQVEGVLEGLVDLLGERGVEGVIGGVRG